MKQFNESFYTDEFDKEMLDFILDNYKVDSYHRLDKNKRSLYYSTVNEDFSTLDLTIPIKSLGLTKNQFKDKIGMTNKTSSEKKIKHWVVETLPENVHHPRTFIATTLDDKNNGFCGEKDNGAYYDCLKCGWKYTPVYEDAIEETLNTFTKSMLVSGKHVTELDGGGRRLLLGERLVDRSSGLLLDNFDENLEAIGDVPDIVSVYEMTEYFTLEDLSSGEYLTLIWQRETPEEAQKRIRKQELEEKVFLLKDELKQAENELEELLG